jgi:hypothetical protein
MPEWLLAVLAGAVGGSVVAFLAKTWIQARLVASIKHEYDQHLERYKRELDKRQKIELVAELFAEWIAVPKGEVVPKERRTRNTLQAKPGAKSYFDVLLLARKELAEDESLKAENITFWGADLEKKGQPVIQQKT